MNAIEKIGRNKPCYCGSGRKYKKCCLAEAPLEKHQLITMRKQDALLEQFSRRHPNESFTVIRNQGQHEVKISALILELADDILGSANTFSQIEKGIMLTIMAWNIALQDKDSWDDSIRVLMGSMGIKEGSDDWFFMFDLVLFLIGKKLNLYPDINRMIIDFDCYQIAGEPQLNVMSIIPKDELTKHDLKLLHKVGT